jgi:outer membrane protein TolC
MTFASEHKKTNRSFRYNNSSNIIRRSGRVADSLHFAHILENCMKPYVAQLSRPERTPRRVYLSEYYSFAASRRKRLLHRTSLFFLLIAFMGAGRLGTAQSRAQENDTVELVQPSGANQAKPPVVITLHDAIEQARKVDAHFRSVVTDAKLAHEDRTQARNAILPTVSYTSQALLTEGNGRTTIGRFVTNDGVHVYRSWGVFHEDLSPGNYLGTAYRQARAAAAMAKARSEIASRGLTATVTKLYYAFAVAQRKYATAQLALDAAKHFYEITEDAERVGQVAHSDVLQAQIQYQQQKQAFEESELAMESARLDLSVILFPNLNENFSIVDDLDSAVALPEFSEVQKMAGDKNPDMQVAMQALRQANQGVTAAKGAFLPSFFVDADYGIEANDFALHSLNVEEPKAGSLPNLGYFVTVGVNVPVWDWGTLRSKLHQAEFKRDQARVELNEAQRQLLNNLYSSYNEAKVARAAVDETRQTADVATESLRLINLRFKAGASNALDVVVAENTLTQARNAYNDSEVRYRVALATLQTITGSF